MRTNFHIKMSQKQNLLRMDIVKELKNYNIILSNRK